jgi:hypothetical protein
VAWFRLLLVVFGAAVLFLAVKYMMTGQRHYLNWAARLIGLFLASGVVFSVILLATRLL